MIKRIGRIHTALVPALFFVFAFDALIFQPAAQSYLGDISLQNFLANVFMLYDNAFLRLIAQHIPNLHFLNYNAFGSDGVLWTVVIEWWLYVTVACTFAIIEHGRQRQLWIIALHAVRAK